MKEFDVNMRIKAAEYSELSPQLMMLAEIAKEATYRSYCPYSHFSVGAAILLSNGQIISGSNQENAAYPSGTCAERVACFYAHSQYPDAKFKAIAIAARDTSGQFVEQPIAPCGACRQALLEYERLAKGPVQMLLAGRESALLIHSIADMLPLAFDEFK